MARYAVIDVGTNSIKCLLAEQAAGGAYQVISDRAEIARLGEKFYETGWLQPEAMARNVREIARMAQAARADGADGDWAVAATAHPAKFEAVVEPLVGHAVEVPPALAELLARPAHAEPVPPDYEALKAQLLG